MTNLAFKPFCEKIILEVGSSWRYWLYEVDSLEFHWHYHSEYEICLTLNSMGKRHVGDYVEDYYDLDLVLLGPDLPHAWTSKEHIKGTKQKIYVAQIPSVWIEGILSKTPELAPISKMLKTSRRGIKFSLKTAKNIKKLLVEMHGLNKIKRFNSLFEILQLMYHDQDSVVLSSEEYALVSNSGNTKDKIDRVVMYIKKNFTKDLRADEMASLAHMSTNHFHRFFKQRTEQTFLELLNQHRIGRACTLLINGNMPINIIGDSCGFNCTSNFNRRFLKHKNCTPTAFRKLYQAK